MKEHILLEAALENVEALIDTSVDNEILKNIPFVGTVFKIIKGTSDIRDRLFAAKILRFIQTLSQVNDRTKEKMRQRVSSEPEEAQKVGG